MQVLVSERIGEHGGIGGALIRPRNPAAAALLARTAARVHANPIIQEWGARPPVRGRYAAVEELHLAASTPDGEKALAALIAEIKRV